MYTKEALKAQLKQMGIKPTDTVVIHTSMKAIGDVEGGPDGVLDAFCEYLSDGLFLVPTHTWDDVTRSNPYFDVRISVPNIGLIPRRAALRKDGIRSLHPTHSVWAYGARAEEFVRGEERSGSPAPVGGCWDRMADWGTKILLIGVDNTKNTFIHSVDERAELPNRLCNTPFDVTVTDWNGKVRTFPMLHHSCSYTDDISLSYGIFEKPMVEMGVQTFGTFADAQVRIVDAMGCRQLIMKIYNRATEDIFLQYTQLPEALYKD
mgnify:CR=1 FL=1